jgi:hypothetical protein
MVIDEDDYDEYLKHFGVLGMKWGQRKVEPPKFSNSATSFVNELGNSINMSIEQDERGVTISANGPTSTVEHTWTPMEAEALRKLLNLKED